MYLHDSKPKREKKRGFVLEMYDCTQIEHETAGYRCGGMKIRLGYQSWGGIARQTGIMSKDLSGKRVYLCTDNDPIRYTCETCHHRLK